MYRGVCCVLPLQVGGRRPLMRRSGRRKKATTRNRKPKESGAYRDNGLEREMERVLASRLLILIVVYRQQPWEQVVSRLDLRHSRIYQRHRRLSISSKTKQYQLDRHCSRTGSFPTKWLCHLETSGSIASSKQHNQQRKSTILQYRRRLVKSVDRHSETLCGIVGKRHTTVDWASASAVGFDSVANSSPRSLCLLDNATHSFGSLCSPCVSSFFPSLYWSCVLLYTVSVVQVLNLYSFLYAIFSILLRYCFSLHITIPGIIDIQWLVLMSNILPRQHQTSNQTSGYIIPHTHTACYFFQSLPFSNARVKP